MKFVERMKRRIHNLIKWFPLIWNDRDTDYRYLLEMQLLKVTYMEEFFRSGKTYNAESEMIADEISGMKHTLERILADNYREEAMRIYNITEYQLENKKYKERLELFKVILQYEQMLRREDLEKIFSKDIASKIENWWD